MPTVFIPNKGVHNFSDAERYGSLFFVSDGLQNRFSVSQISRFWIEALRESKPEDFILLTSLTIINCIGCAVFVAKHGVLNLLLYKSGKYISRQIVLKET